MWSVCETNSCLFARDHQAEPASEWETYGAGKSACDVGRVSGQTEDAYAQRICECMYVCLNSESEDTYVDFRPY